MTIQFYQPPSFDGQPNLSQFCVKTQIMLAQSGLDYETVIAGDPTKGPKSKVPYIIDGGEPLGDSAFIEKHLRKAHGVDFYAGTTALQQANARMIQSTIEEKLYWVMVYSRWQIEDNWPIMDEIFFGQMPPEMRLEISKIARDSVISALWGQGIGRHTPEEVFEIGTEIIENLSDILGDNTHFVVSQFTTLDAAAYGSLINFIQNPVPTPLKALILSKGNLCSFLDSMSEKYFPDVARTSND